MFDPSQFDYGGDFTYDPRTDSIASRASFVPAPAAQPTFTPPAPTFTPPAPSMQMYFGGPDTSVDLTGIGPLMSPQATQAPLMAPAPAPAPVDNRSVVIPGTDLSVNVDDFLANRTTALNNAVPVQSTPVAPMSGTPVGAFGADLTGADFASLRGLPGPGSLANVNLNVAQTTPAPTPTPTVDERAQEAVQSVFSPPVNVSYTTDEDPANVGVTVLGTSPDMDNYYGGPDTSPAPVAPPAVTTPTTTPTSNVNVTGLTPTPLTIGTGANTGDGSGITGGGITGGVSNEALMNDYLNRRFGSTRWEGAGGKLNPETPEEWLSYYNYYAINSPDADERANWARMADNWRGIIADLGTTGGSDQYSWFNPVNFVNTVDSKASYYNYLRGLGYSDAQIRAAADAKLADQGGAGTDEMWSALTTRANQLLTGKTGATTGLTQSDLDKALQEALKASATDYENRISSLNAKIDALIAAQQAVPKPTVPGTSYIPPSLSIAGPIYSGGGAGPVVTGSSSPIPIRTVQGPSGPGAVIPGAPAGQSPITLPGAGAGVPSAPLTGQLPGMTDQYDLQRFVNLMQNPGMQNLTPTGVDLSKGYYDRLGNFIPAAQIPQGPPPGYAKGGDVNADMLRELMSGDMDEVGTARDMLEKYGMSPDGEYVSRETRPTGQSVRRVVKKSSEQPGAREMMMALESLSVDKRREGLRPEVRARDLMAQDMSRATFNEPRLTKKRFS